MKASTSKLVLIGLITLCLLVESQTVILPETSGSSCCDDNSIYVNGQGKVSVQPDIATVNVAISVTSKTSQ
jgi:uncharacterized protein YggE